MTTTAHEDQFTLEPATPPPGWATRDMVDMYAKGRTDERAAVVKLLLKHGYRQIADAIEAGEHNDIKP